MRKTFFIVFAALQTMMVTTPVARAAIHCKDGFQRVEGQYLSTPYCNDALLAQVARENGEWVSDAQIRWNPAKKDEVCRFVGNDPRVQLYCPDSDSGSSH